VNVSGATIVLRERTILDVLDLSVLFAMRSGGRGYVRLAALLLVPCFLALLALRHFAGVGWPFIWTAAIGLHAVLELPFLTLAGRLLFEPEQRVLPALKASWRRLPAYLGTGALVLGLLVVSSVTLVGPWFIATLYCFVPEILVLEGASGLPALRRARGFLLGRSGTGIATLTVRFVLLGAFVLLVDELGHAALGVLLDVHVEMERLTADGGSPFALAGLLLSVPLMATFRFLAYVNERTLQDGWDVQVALLAVAGDVETGAGGGVSDASPPTVPQARAPASPEAP